MRKSQYLWAFPGFGYAPCEDGFYQVTTQNMVFMGYKFHYFFIFLMIFIAGFYRGWLTLVSTSPGLSKGAQQGLCHILYFPLQISMNYMFVSWKLGGLIAESRINTGLFKGALGNYEIPYQGIMWVWDWGYVDMGLGFYGCGGGEGKECFSKEKRIVSLFEKFQKFLCVTVCSKVFQTWFHAFQYFR